MLRDRKFRNKKVPYGTGGWIEGYDIEKIPITRFVGNTTGYAISVRGHHEITYKDLYNSVSNYDKHIRDWFSSHTKEEIINEFLKD